MLHLLDSINGWDQVFFLFFSDFVKIHLFWQVLSLKDSPFESRIIVCHTVSYWVGFDVMFFSISENFILEKLIYIYNCRVRVAQWGRWLDYLTTHTSLSPIRRGFAPGFVNCKKGALDWQPQVIEFTSCLHMVGGSHRVFRLLPPLKLVAMV